MAQLEELHKGALVRGILPNNALAKVEEVTWHGNDVITLRYRALDGKGGEILWYRDQQDKLQIEGDIRLWMFDGDGACYRLVSEANRIRLAYLFDPLLAVHSSLLEPLPHQITAVYEVMLPRMPLRFLLADDPGAGKTIMAGLLIKELLVRGDVRRCMIVCPGNLVEQWQDELSERFHLPFEIMTTDKLNTARSGNWFLENNLVIVRLDKAARDESVQAKLAAPECRWDLVIVDEAHKMAATFYGGEIKYTKRYKLGQLLSRISRHFLLLTATPHNGKGEDFQLFLALLDGDRFEGRFRDGVHQVDVSDLMRRMVKEHLVRFDGRPLFPERFAHTVSYRLSDHEAHLYKEVTEYVKEEFNRADALADEKRKGTVGFALTTLQRRLASSPEAIYQSLCRRRERLERRLRELELLHRGESISTSFVALEQEELEELEEAPEAEVELKEDEILDQATAAGTIEELRAEIDTLKRLEELAQQVRSSGEDRKWRELAKLLHDLFFTSRAPDEKLIIFTEHRDTLNYLVKRIATLLGQQAVVFIHGAMGREDRRKAQETFLNNPEVRVLVATDAAGEGINLQRAHLMINYDLPWNPNRIEQRFGRIHRIGQTEPCHLWNMVAIETREGDVYYTLLKKLEEARAALGGKVFDVLGKLQFEGRPLRDLLIEAIRYGERPEVKMKLSQAIEQALNTSHLQDLVEERALAQEIIHAERLQRIREDMERAAARRLQPHYIESFFLEVFRQLGGSIDEREPRRYEITHVPAAIRQRDRLIGIREPVLHRYERITFEKELVTLPGKPLAAFVCPGHPLLDAVIDLVLEHHRVLLQRGAILVDDSDPSTEPRAVFMLEHALQDGTQTPSGEQRVISRRLLFVELDRSGQIRNAGYAPYLDFRPLRDEDEPLPEEILARPECTWITQELEAQVLDFAVNYIVPEHLEEVRRRRLELIEKTRTAVKDRLTKEIAYWDHRAEQLRLQEQAGKPITRLNWQEARRRADELQDRLNKRMDELDSEKQITALPPVIVGGFVVVPAGLLAKMRGEVLTLATPAADTQTIAARARAIVMEAERRLGYEPTDREFDHLGYDIESRDPRTGRLRFIEVKGRVADADTITVTRNEILTSLNKPDDYILAIVIFEEGGTHRLYYVRRPFQREPDFGVTSVNYDLSVLLSQAEEVV